MLTNPFVLFIASCILLLFLSFTGMMTNITLSMRKERGNKTSKIVNNLYAICMVVAMLASINCVAFMGGMEKEEFKRYIKVNKVLCVKSTGSIEVFNAKIKKKTYQTLVCSKINYYEIVPK
jgi:p-aminobenzoyl-glutamate transporter AbgT